MPGGKDRHCARSSSLPGSRACSIRITRRSKAQQRAKEQSSILNEGLVEKHADIRRWREGGLFRMKLVNEGAMSKPALDAVLPHHERDWLVCSISEAFVMADALSAALVRI